MMFTSNQRNILDNVEKNRWYLIREICDITGIENHLVSRTLGQFVKFNMIKKKKTKDRNRVNIMFIGDD